MRRVVQAFLRKAHRLRPEAYQLLRVRACAIQADTASQPKVSEALLCFKSSGETNRPLDAAQLAKELGVEVKETECDISGIKQLIFRGMSADAFKSLQPEEEASGQPDHRTEAPTARDKLEDMIEAAAQKSPPQHRTYMQEQAVSRYRARKLAAATALQRAGLYHQGQGQDTSLTAQQAGHG